MELIAVSDFLIASGKVFSFALSILLVVLVLLQKEKGGGLAGAFGGSGSTSTFGVKTSDVASKITWWLFSIWLVISLSLVILTKKDSQEDIAAQPIEEVQSADDQKEPEGS